LNIPLIPPDLMVKAPFLLVKPPCFWVKSPLADPRLTEIASAAKSLLPGVGPRPTPDSERVMCGFTGDLCGFNGSLQEFNDHKMDLMVIY
jgi:hypothetical protein